MSGREFSARSGQRIYIFALPAEVFSLCLAIVSAVMVGGFFLWLALRYGTGYQTVWEIWSSAETLSNVHWRRFYFQLTRVHSALELSGRCALQIYLLTYLLTRLNSRTGLLKFWQAITLRNQSAWAVMSADCQYWKVSVMCATPGSHVHQGLLWLRWDGRRDSGPLSSC